MQTVLLTLSFLPKFIMSLTERDVSWKAYVLLFSFAMLWKQRYILKVMMFQNFSHLFTSPVNNLATALLSMLLPCGMLYLMISEQPPPLVLSEKGSKHTSTTKHALLSLLQCILLSSMVRDPCYIPGHEF